MPVFETPPRELDEVMTQYREHLRKIGVHLAQMTQLGHCDVTMSKGTEEMVDRLERAVGCFMDKEVLYERARQTLLDLKLVLDISRQTVEAKSKHLNQEEKQKEEVQSLRFKEFQRIHNLQDEQSVFERELMPAKRKLAKITELLDEKSEKLRNLENFHGALAEHCALDMILLKDKTDESRAERSKWDRLNLDVWEEVKVFPLTTKELEQLEGNVLDLKDALQNHKRWYDEELQTKLFYSTRSKEIKHRITYFKNVLRRLEKTGRSEDIDEEHEERRLSRRSEQILVDGSPGVQAKEVEFYLSRQFGMKVLADYTILRRLKDEIGVQGLAYLVEKVRLQGSGTSQFSTPPASRVYTDWEEKRVEQALMSIALEYRDRDENKRMLRIPGMSYDVLQTTHDKQESMVAGAVFPSSSCLSFNSETTGRTTTPDTSTASCSTGRRSSSSSLKRRPSLARIKKFLKF